MRVLIIPEDPSLDQHILKPVVTQIFADLHRPARVDVLTDPHVRGAAQALNPTFLHDVVQDHPMIDLFVLVVDRDCDRAGHEAKAAARAAERPGVLVSAVAWQEIEVWALALHRREIDAPWAQVRAECDPKERFFDDLVGRRGWDLGVGRGRKAAMRELRKGWSGLLQLCPEVAGLREHIRQAIGA